MNAKALLVFILAILSLTSLTFASTTTVLEDASTSTYEIGNWGTLNNITLAYTDGVTRNEEPYWKFNTTDMNSRIIDSLQFSTYLENGCGGTAYKNLQYTTNVSWSEATINGSNKPSLLSTFTSIPINVSSTQIYSGDVITEVVAGKTAFIDTVYKNNEITIGSQSGWSGGCASSPPFRVYATSKEGGNPSYLNYNLVDYKSETVQATDLSLVYFDFETGYASSSYFSEADFVYNASTDSITPYVPMSFDTSVDSNENILESVACSEEGVYTLTPATNPNNPSGSYDIFCFTLSGNHNGKDYFGAIQVLNNTNVRGGAGVDFDFNYAIYSPDFSTFGIPVFSDYPIQAHRNYTVSWSSTQVVTTGLKYRYSTSIGWSDWRTIYNDTAYSKAHSVQIPVEGEYLFPDKVYEYYVYGTTSINSTYSSPVYNFTTVPFQIEFDDISTGIHIITQDSNGIPVIAYVSLNGGVPVRASEQLTNESYEYGFVRMTSFYGVGTGTYNISVSADGYTTQNLTITAETIPYYYTVSLQKSSTCFVGREDTTNATIYSTINNTIHVTFADQNITSWYAEYDTQGCIQFDTSGTCTHYGTWKVYLCLDGYHPSGKPINMTVPLSASGVLQDQYGFDFSLMLATISFVLAIVIGIGSGYLVKDGLVMVVTSVLVLMLFTFIGWLPIYIMIIFGLLSAMIGAMMVRRSLAGD